LPIKIKPDIPSIIFSSIPPKEVGLYRQRTNIQLNNENFGVSEAGINHHGDTGFHSGDFDYWQVRHQPINVSISGTKYNLKPMKDWTLLPGLKQRDHYSSLPPQISQTQPGQDQTTNNLHVFKIGMGNYEKT
jgi:hypothetical protein